MPFFSFERTSEKVLYARQFSSTIISQLTFAQNGLCLLAAIDSCSWCDEGLRKDDTVSRLARHISAVH